MAQFELMIRSNDSDEFESLVARFLGSAANVSRSAPAPAQEPTGEQAQSDTEAAPAPAKRGRKTKADQTPPQPTQQPDGTPIPPVSEPVPQPTPGGTDAPPAESIPPNQEAAVDPFATEQASPTPSASSPEVEAAQNAGEVTVQMLKDAMAGLLKAKSAAFAMQTLEGATGCKSLTSGSPSVIEKAKDDPDIMKRAHDALIAGATAA